MNAIQDIYIIPSSDKKFIVYSPLRSISFLANERAVEVINDYLNGIEIPKEHVKLREHFEKINAINMVTPKEYKIEIIDKAVFILTQKCNLACSYCYAQGAHSQDTLDKDKIKTIVDCILSTHNNKLKSFSFIGGGEPTVTWDLFTWSVHYIKSKAIQQRIDISLTTNATLLDEKRIVWLKQNNIRVGVSFDILPEIQNSQRGFPNNSKNSFEIVDKSIKLLISNGLKPRLRSTITNKNVNLMPEMVEFVIENYPQLKQLHFEHVTDMEQSQTAFYS